MEWRWNVWKRMKNISRVELFTVRSRLTQPRVLSSVERRENKQTLNNSWSWMLLDYTALKEKLHKHAMISLRAEVSSTLLHYAELASEREEHSCGRAGMWSRSCECFSTLFSSTSKGELSGMFTVECSVSHFYASSTGAVPTSLCARPIAEARWWWWNSRKNAWEQPNVSSRKIELGDVSLLEHSNELANCFIEMRCIKSGMMMIGTVSLHTHLIHRCWSLHTSHLHLRYHRWCARFFFAGDGWLMFAREWREHSYKNFQPHNSSTADVVLRLHTIPPPVKWLFLTKEQSKADRKMREKRRMKNMVETRASQLHLL